MSALRLMSENDLDDVTVEHIAAAANVSTRTFFNYFPSKDDVLGGPSAEEAADFVDRVVAQRKSLSALKALGAVIGEDIVRMEQVAEDWTLWMRAVQRNPQLLPRLIGQLGEAEHQYAVAVAARTGRSPDALYPRLVAGCALTVLRVAIGQALDSQRSISVREALSEALAIAASGLAEPR